MTHLSRLKPRLTKPQRELLEHLAVGKISNLLDYTPAKMLVAKRLAFFFGGWIYISEDGSAWLKENRK